MAMEPDEGAIIIETATAIRIDLLLPDIPIDTIKVDKVGEGIMVQAEDQVSVQTFIPLPQMADLSHMSANIEGRQLSLLIPKR